MLSELEDSEITVLYGTQTGNAEELAERTCAELEDHDFKARILDMAEAELDFLKDEMFCLICVSTWGDGEPPDEALPFYEELTEADEMDLENLHFSVLALGDTDYEFFCKCGKDFDEHLERHGAKRIHSRQDCDVDYEVDFEKWLSGVVDELVKMRDGK